MISPAGLGPDKNHSGIGLEGWAIGKVSKNLTPLECFIRFD